jgi:hypothetical protein
VGDCFNCCLVTTITGFQKKNPLTQRLYIFIGNIFISLVYRHTKCREISLSFKEKILAMKYLLVLLLCISTISVQAQKTVDVAEGNTNAMSPSFFTVVNGGASGVCKDRGWHSLFQR